MLEQHAIQFSKSDQEAISLALQLASANLDYELRNMGYVTLFRTYQLEGRDQVKNLIKEILEVNE